MNKSKGLAGGEYRKVMITLTPNQENFLDNLRNEIRGQKGASVSRTEIIRALVELLATFKLNLKDVHDEDELLNRFKQAIGK
jgi:hypothetical protein